MERYLRQTILPEIGPEGQQRIRQAKVLLVGVGGLGSPIALYLVGAGIGTLGLVDNDVVSLTNLQRQVLYREAEIGQSKVECAVRTLQALNSEVEIHPFPLRLTRDNAKDLISHYDIVVDGCDNFATRYIISDACAELHKPYVFGAIREFDGQVGIFCCGEGARTYRDLFPEDTTSREHLAADKSAADAPQTVPGVLAVTPAVVGSVEASEVLKLIVGMGQPLVNKLWSINLLTLESHVFEW